MKKEILFLFITVLIWPRASNGQMLNDHSQNLRVVDSAEESMKDHWCNGILLYEGDYDKKKVEKDLTALYFLNQLFNSDSSISRIDRLSASLTKVSVVRNEIHNGLIEIVDLVINGTFLRIEVTVEAIGEIAIRKTCNIYTTTSGRCDISRRRVPDFRLLKQIVAKAIDFSVRMKPENLFSDTLLMANIQRAAQKNPGYRFCIPSVTNKNWVNEIMLRQYETAVQGFYSYRVPDADFVALIRSGEIASIKDLLYSPNYVFAINAMEAITYLSANKKIGVDDDMRQRMKAIKSEKFRINIKKTDDFIASVPGYENLHVTEDQVLKKYESAFH